MSRRQQPATPPQPGSHPDPRPITRAADQHYAFKYCSPSRCALQSGRNPLHVNVLNSDIRQHNEAVDPVGGFQGIPVNMTTIAAKLSALGYQAHAAGKW